MVRGHKTKDVKREALARFGITARHFNGIRFQAVQAWKGSVRYRISQVPDRIEAVEGRIERLGHQIEAAKTEAHRAKLRLARREAVRAEVVMFADVREINRRAGPQQPAALEGHEAACGRRAALAGRIPSDPRRRPALVRHTAFCDMLRAARPRRTDVVALRKSPVVQAEVVSDPSVMSGDPVVRGTRIPAETIVAYLRAGRSAREIFEDYPTLPIDGIEAVERWAEETHGRDWRQAARAPTP